MIPVAWIWPVRRTVRLGLLSGVSAAASLCGIAATLAAAAAATAVTPSPVPTPLYRVERPADAAAGRPAIELSVGADNQAELTLVRSAPAPAGESLRFVLSSFKSADEGSFRARVFLHDRHAPDTPDGGFTIPAGSLVLPLTIFAPDLPPVGTWRGTLTLVPPAPAQPTLPIALSLTRTQARPATLIVEGAPAPVVVTLGLLGRTPEGPLVSVTLRDLNGYGPVEGVRAVIESVAQAPDPGFDAGRQLSFWFDGRPVADFLSWPPRSGDERTLAARGQARLGIGWRDLAAGDTTLTLRVRAANSGDDDRQRVTLKLHVRHPLPWAIAVLLGGIAVSFLGTQVVTRLRRAAAVERDTRELEGGWLRDEPALSTLPAVIGVRAALAQARELSRKWPLWVGDAPDKRIEAARATLQVIRLARDVRASFDDADWMMRYHGQREARDVVIKLGVSPDAAALADARTRLATVTTWRTTPAAYWSAVEPYASRLTARVSPQDAKTPEARALLEELLGRLRDRIGAASAAVSQGAGQAEVAAVEDAYARLKVASEHAARHSDTLEELAACKDKPLDVFFRVADDLAWERLKQPAVLAQLEIEPPPESACETFRPLTFSVRPGTEAGDELAELAQGYLFRYGTRFHWTLAPRHTDGGVHPLTPVSEGPTVVQFAPVACELDVSVALTRARDTAPTVLRRKQPVTVRASPEFGWVRTLSRVEWLYLGLATLVALVSGLSASYLKSPSFGSLQDYFTLFLLGVGADQVKNLAQSLSAGAAAGGATAGAASSPAAAPPAPAAPQPPPAPAAAPTAPAATPSAAAPAAGAPGAGAAGADATVPARPAPGAPSRRHCGATPPHRHPRRLHRRCRSCRARR